MHTHRESLGIWKVQHVFLFPDNTFHYYFIHNDPLVLGEKACAYMTSFMTRFELFACLQILPPSYFQIEFIYFELQDL